MSSRPLFLPKPFPFFFFFFFYHFISFSFFSVSSLFLTKQTAKPETNNPQYISTKRVYASPLQIHIPSSLPPLSPLFAKLSSFSLFWVCSVFLSWVLIFHQSSQTQMLLLSMGLYLFNQHHLKDQHLGIYQRVLWLQFLNIWNLQRFAS